MRTKAADISGRGCYVETMLPLPVGKALVVISLWLDAQKSGTRRQWSDPAMAEWAWELNSLASTKVTPGRLQQQIETMAAEQTTRPPGNANGAG